MGFVGSIKSGFSRFIDFKTRSSRSEFWWWVLFTTLASLALTAVGGVLFGPTVEQTNAGGTMMTYDGGMLSVIFNIVIFLPYISITCRRLHDIDKSGWWQLIFLIPLIGFIILIYWFVKSGNDGPNRFGDDPL